MGAIKRLSKRFGAVCILAVAAACASPDAPELWTCYRKLDAGPSFATLPDRTVQVHAALTVVEDVCRVPALVPGDFVWSSSRPDIAQVVSAVDSVADVKALKVGTTTITVFLQSDTTVRGSMTLIVAGMVDGGRVVSRWL